MHPREIEFINNYFTHNEWEYEPRKFRLYNSTYTPDFYDGKRDVFIEVVGTKQAFHNNKRKYVLVKKNYPEITLELRSPSGKIFVAPKIKKECQKCGHKWIPRDRRICVCPLCKIQLRTRRIEGFVAMFND